jgi:hypothetical protein
MTRIDAEAHVRGAQKEGSMNHDPARFHPVQTTRVNSLPESVVLAAYEVYCHVYGAQPAMIDVQKGCRGGFSWGEIAAFLYARSFPKAEWRTRVDAALERPR